MKTEKIYSASDSMPLLSEGIILHLAEMASQYGFLILRPYYGQQNKGVVLNSTDNIPAYLPDTEEP